MPTALITRTAVVAVYLLALLFKGRADLLTGVIGAAVVAVWAAALLRDTMMRPSRPPRARH